MTVRHRELRTVEHVTALLHAERSLTCAVIEGVDLTTVEVTLGRVPVRDAVFLGCTLSPGAAADLVRRGAAVFPALSALPYRPYRGRLYTPDELYDGFVPTHPETYAGCLDARIHQHWATTGRDDPALVESLARHLHDLSVVHAMKALLANTEARAVAVMGGHALSRTDPVYREVAVLSRTLTRRGYRLVSGGGPGAMEATHLGAWLSEHPDDALPAALALLAPAPGYTHERWLSTAFAVRRSFPPVGDGHRSLAIPTWLYGHEPPTPLATDIAKLFDNSVREDGLVTVAMHGIVFAPGSAGTVQELFQDATQNHYATLGDISPVVLFGRHYWEEELPVAPLLRALSRGRPYADMIGTADTPEETVVFLEAHPPRPG